MLLNVLNDPKIKEFKEKSDRIISIFTAQTNVLLKEELAKEEL